MKLIDKMLSQKIPDYCKGCRHFSVHSSWCCLHSKQAKKAVGYCKLKGGREVVFVRTTSGTDYGV